MRLLDPFKRIQAKRKPKLIGRRRRGRAPTKDARQPAQSDVRRLSPTAAYFHCGLLPCAVLSGLVRGQNLLVEILIAGGYGWIRQRGFRKLDEHHPSVQFSQ